MLRICCRVAWSIKWSSDPNYGTDRCCGDIHDVGMLGHNPNGSKPSTTARPSVVGTRPAVRGMQPRHVVRSGVDQGLRYFNGKVSESGRVRGSYGNLHMKGMASTTVFTHFSLEFIC